MKSISKLHYITQDLDHVSHQELTLEACKAGVKLIQLRMKQIPESHRLEIAKETKSICLKYGTQLIVNDYLDLALAVDADGVHLGQGDTDHQKARQKFGSSKIIGGTAYSLDEARMLANQGIVDYIGLGNYRKTRTKPEIKNFLSLSEIQSLTTELQMSTHKPIPVIVIGGIKESDVIPLLNAGAHGIAVASLISESKNKTQAIENLYNSLTSLKP